MPNNKAYLGDGLYAFDDGYMVRLQCNRKNGVNWVGLEPEVLLAFIGYLERSRNLTINIKKNPSKETLREIGVQVGNGDDDGIPY